MKRTIIYSYFIIVLTLILPSTIQAEPSSTQQLSAEAPPPPTFSIVKNILEYSETEMSTLERFQYFNGPRIPAALIKLFSNPITSSIKQHPEISLSDGTSIISIEAEFAISNDNAPNFACIGAQIISAKRNESGTWVITALPIKHTLKVSLTLLTDSIAQEIPLNVAPPVPPGTDLSEQGFIAFLGDEQGTASHPRQDLNNDGKRDYLDDYIFTANYLVNQRSIAPVLDGNRKPENQPPPNSPTTGETPGAGPGIDAESVSAIKPETGADRKSPASRNERARKMQELLKRPAK